MIPEPLMQADMNWFGVLAHHARLRPDSPITVFEGETTTYAEMAERATRLAGGLAAIRGHRGGVVALLSYNCPEFLETVFAANYLGAIAMPVNWRLAAPEVRYILEHSGARVLVADDPLIDLADEATEGMGAAPVRACVSPAAPEGWTALDDLRATPDRNGAPSGGGRRRPPPDVHVGDHGTAQGRHDHPRQPGVEEPGPHRRVRVLPFGPRAGVWSPLSRGRAGPHHHVADRSRSHNHHPPLVRRRRGGRRDRTVACDHGLVGPGHGQRHHGPARISGDAICPRCGWSSTAAKRCPSPSSSGSGEHFRRHGSPMPTASPRRFLVTPFSTGTAW